jgi:excisionase family DNA binding protein
MRAKSEPEREYDSPKERAAILGVHVNTIYRAIRDRSLAAERIRGSWRLPRRKWEGDAQSSQ